MSLTNDQITAQNFKMFFDEIRPYLNGTPPTYANMFNRSDLYSTDEKIVGCWIDGKPLYQKTFYSSTYTNAEWKVIGTIDDFETVVSESGMIVNVTLGFHRYALGCGVYDDNDMHSVLQVNQQGKVIVYARRVNDAWQDVYVTVKYTKTTDTAIKVGTGNDYSTDEQIVGTWIDGKPIYQKTIDCGSFPNNSVKNVAHGISNIKNVISISGYAKNTNNSYWSDIRLLNDLYPDVNTQVLVDATNIMISCRKNDNGNSGWLQSYCTLQYTKTTD